MTTVSATPSTARLGSLIDAMAGQPVVMLVDLVADRFITGIPKRISREAPVLILEFQNELLVPGGGANAVANVRALGGEPLPIGIVGDDSNGAALLEELRSRDIATDSILTRAGYRTPTKTRILGGGRHAIKQQIVRYDIEEPLTLRPEEHERLREQLVRVGPRARVAVLSDYGYGAVNGDMVATVRRQLAGDGLVLCDSRYQLQSFVGMDGATPNEEEAEALFATFGEDTDAPGSFDEAGRRLRARLAARFLLITRGSCGMALFADGKTAHIPVHGTDQVADVTGAGDTVIATFALALAAGATPLEATLLANYAGGIVVMKTGTASLDRDELRQAVEADASLLEELRWVKS